MEGKRIGIGSKISVVLASAVVVSLIVGTLLGWLAADVFEKEAAAPDEPYLPAIDPSKFTNIVDNEFFPLTPGTKTVFEETVGGQEHTEVTVLNETKVVLGVTCVTVRDTVSLGGVVIEDTYDWYAQDDRGNVWYFGEDSKGYKNGAVISTSGSWEAGVDGAMPGIVMLAHPLIGLSYRQEYYKGEAEDMARVVSINESAVVEYGSLHDLLMTSEWTPLEPGLVEHKYYAAGIGVVLERTVKGGSERVELAQVVH